MCTQTERVATFERVLVAQFALKKTEIAVEKTATNAEIVPLERISLEIALFILLVAPTKNDGRFTLKLLRQIILCKIHLI